MFTLILCIIVNSPPPQKREVDGWLNVQDSARCVHVCLGGEGGGQTWAEITLYPLTPSPPPPPFCIRSISYGNYPVGLVALGKGGKSPWWSAHQLMRLLGDGAVNPRFPVVWHNSLVKETKCQNAVLLTVFLVLKTLKGWCHEKIFTWFLSSIISFWSYLRYKYSMRMLTLIRAAGGVYDFRNFNPNSHGVGYIGPTLFWRKIAKKYVKCEIFLKIS